MEGTEENNNFETEKEGVGQLKYSHMSEKRSTKVDATQAVDEYIGKQDWRITANANTGYSHAGLINNLAGKLIANYWLDEVYSKEEGDAHRNGDYHIHDLDSLAPYCCGHDFQKILDEGFNGVVGRVGSKPPKHLREALYQLANYFGILQAEWAGAQAVSSFDTYLAPYVFFDMEVNGVSYDDIKKAMRNFVFNLNVPSRWGQCVPDTYKCLRGDGRWVRYNELKEGDEIYVVDKETGALKKDKLTHINIYASPDTLHQYYDKETGFNFCVTDKHRVIHKTPNGNFEITESKKLLEQSAIAAIPISRWTPISAEEYLASNSALSDDIIELIALIVSCADTEDNKIRFQIGNQNNADLYLENRLEDLLDNLKIGYIRQNHPVISGVTIYELNTKGYKQVPEEITNILRNPEAFIQTLSIRQANIIIDTWTLVMGNFNGQSWTLKESRFAFNELLPLLILKSGKAVKCPIGKDETIIYKRGTRNCTIKEVDTAYEKVWCPTTDTGTFVCMTDNGYVFFTGNSPFTNVTIDWTVPNLMKDLAPTRGGKNYYQSIIDEWKERGKDTNNIIKAIRKRFEEIDKDTYDALKDDDDAILLSFTYRFLQKDMRVIDRAFYEVLNEGDVLGQPFTFPIPTINITEDFDWDGENTDLLFENTAKYGSSYFQNFIGSQYMIDENGNKVRDPNAYSPNDVRSMCPLSIDTLVPTNNGIKRLLDLDEHADRVFLHGAWYPFRKIIDIPTQQCYMIRLNGYLPNGEQIAFKAGAYHLQPVYSQETRSYVKKYVSSISEADFIPVEGVFDAQTYQYIVPNGNFFIAGDDSLQYIQVESITPIPYQPLMCLEVANDEHCFTLANGVVTSNCRLQLDKRQLRRRGGGLFGSESRTGSVGVITINCPRLGYCHKGDLEGLYKQFDHLCDMAKSTLEKKRKFVIDMLDRGLYPYTRRYIGSFETYFSTIGVNGINEMIRNFTNDEHDITDEYGQKFANDFLDHLRERLLMYQEETGNLYNGEASPGEGCLKGDTCIWTDKGFKKIIDLVDKEDVHVFTFNEETGDVELQPVEATYMTAEKAPVMKITFDNGREITCTRFHPFAKREFIATKHQFDWVEACNLSVGDHVKSVYLREKDTGHVVFGQKSKVHRIVAKAKYGEIPEGYVVHHLDENKWNNSLENIVIMTAKEHKSLHIRKRQENGEMRGSGFGEKNSFYGKHHNLETRMHISDMKCTYTPEDRERMVDAYVNGHLSFAQIGRLLGFNRILVKECIRTMQRNGLVKVDWPTCGSWQFEETPIEYLVKQGKTKSEIIDLLKGSKAVREETSSYIDYLTEANHVITKIEYLNEEIPVYNMTVKGNHNYYVSDREDAKDAILVHNCMRRFAHLDKKKYPDILQAGFSDSIPYYTNSSQLPVEFTADVFTALDLQDNLQKKYTGGCVEKGNFIATNHGLIKIEEIVSNFKTFNNLLVYSFNPSTKKVELDKVLDAMEIDVSKHDKIKVAWNGGDIVTSDWHPFFRENGDSIEEVRADELKAGDVIVGSDSKWLDVISRTVTSVSKIDVEDNTFYDLTTEKNHNYLAGKESMVFVHNTVFHVYTRERIKSVESCKRLVKTIMTNYRLPYISITPTFSTCPIHGRIEGEHEYCPKCDQEIIMKHLSEVDLNEG